MKNNNKIIVSAIVLSIALIVVGVCINKGLQSLSNRNRIVTVKGLAEKQIKADKATIHINFSFTGNETNTLIMKMRQEEDRIIKLLRSLGYKQLVISDIDIYDSKSYYENAWNGERMVKVEKDRYRFSKYIQIVMDEVEKASAKAKEINLELVSNGITSTEVDCSYKFPELNDIKPELIAESTKNARIAGEQFAQDSQSKLGKIKTASQGQITIAGQYYNDGITTAPSQPYFQKVRVVSTIIFFLED